MALCSANMIFIMNILKVLFNMKKIMSTGLVIVMICLCFVGCAKCIETDVNIEQVQIVDTYHRGEWIQPIIISGKLYTFIHHSSVYVIIVSYNGVKYEINGEKPYDKYKNRVGEIVNATIEKNSYDDGTIKYSVVALE